MSTQATPSIRKPRRPRVVSCSGPTARARLAEEVAVRLRSLEVVAAGEVRTVAIDGCSSACASRRLEAKGIRPATVTLDELGDELDERALEVLLARVVRQLAEPARAEPASRRRRSPPAAAAGPRKAHSTADYLFAVYTLTSPVVACGAVASDLPTVASHVARALSVSRPAAGEMLARLERGGLIERGPGKEILLTERGRAAAAQVVRRHRVVERFLTDVLDYSSADSHDLALQIRDGFDEAVIERLAALLAPASCCPHGWPLDPADEDVQLAGLVALPALAVATRATIVAFAEHDAELLTALSDLGLTPGAPIQVLERRNGGQLVATGGQRGWVGDAAAGAVLVRAS